MSTKVTIPIFSLDTSFIRNLSTELMMGNFALAVTLANVHFANPVTAVPNAVSDTIHSATGSNTAATWRFSPSIKHASTVKKAPIRVESLYSDLDEED